MGCYSDNETMIDENDILITDDGTKLTPAQVNTAENSVTLADSEGNEWAFELDTVILNVLRGKWDRR